MSRYEMPRQAKKMYARLEADLRTGEMLLRTHYDVVFISQFKRIFVRSADKRAWDAPFWRFDPEFTDQVVACVREYLGFDLTEEARNARARIRAVKPKIRERFIVLDYLGAARDRGSGYWSAYGMVQGGSGWDLEMPLDVMKRFFNVDPSQVLMDYYAILAIPRTATAEVIKSGFRRAARATHPDVNMEPDANEKFVRVTVAYGVLSTPLGRRKYDAAQRFVQEVQKDEAKQLRSTLGKMRQVDRTLRGGRTEQVWTPPIRCGELTVKVQERMGRMKVLEIVSWDDQVRSRDGAVRVTFWSGKSVV